MQAIPYIFTSIIILMIIGIIAMILKPTSANKKQEPSQNQKISDNQTEYIRQAYQQKWMFTLNEKNIFYELEKIVKEEGYRLFAKVRLFDLVTPITNHPKYKTNLWKIQAKHLDFVITTNNLVAKYVIELDDNSHNTANRKQRDEFVDTVLQTCGYKVLHIRGIQEDVIRNFLRENKTQEK